MPEPAPFPHPVTALALFSGGLDSIVACRLVMAQGITVRALKFVTPFFGYDLLADEEGYRQSVRSRYGIEVELHDLSEPYLTLLRHPPHGFGKHFNPCIDCKILLASEARRLMDRYHASFLISGEVVGQRPMSQRRDAMRVVERESGCEDLLLRPLCAKLLPPTLAERQGLIDRERLSDLKGRSRHGQMALADQVGISDYPSPAGGCLLTDPTLGERIKRFYGERPAVSVADMLLIQTGRQFALPGGGWLALGRNERENARLLARAAADDLLLTLEDRPGPVAVLRGEPTAADLEASAGLVARYGKKLPGRQDAPAPVRVLPGTAAAALGRDPEATPEPLERLSVPPLRDEVFRPWQR